MTEQQANSDDIVIDEETEKTYKEAFNNFDKNGDGHIQASELMTVMRKLGENPSQAEAEEMIAEAIGTTDQEKVNQGITFPEFRKMMMKQKGKNKDEDLREAFRFFDRNGNGLIDAEELAIVMEKVGEHLTKEEVAEMIREADKNGDDQIDYEEFVQMMSN